MNAKQYKIGHNRTQSDLLPTTLDDYDSELNPVRAIDAYVDSIDLECFTLNAMRIGLSIGCFQPCSVLFKKASC